QKTYRFGEMVDLVVRYAADIYTRQKLVDIYMSLADRERYNDIVDLRLRIINRIFPFRMRSASGDSSRASSSGADSGQATLGHSEFGSMHSLLNDGAGENVLLVALADYMAKTEIAKIDLLKLDIEGSELNALKDLGDRIAARKRKTARARF